MTSQDLWGANDNLNAIINSIGDPVFVKDERHRLILVNDAECRLAGATREQLLGKTDYDFFPKEQVDLFWARDEEILRAGKEIVSEEQITDASGRLRFISTKKTLYTDAAGSRFIVGIIRDVTEHRQQDQALKAYTTEISDLYNRAPCGYHSLGPDGTFLGINDTELAWLGYRREELVGKKKMGDILSAESRTAFERNFPGLKERGWVKDVEAEFVRKDGSILPVLLSSTVLRGPAGEYLASRTTMIDLTELKRARAEQTRLQAQFIQAQKMEAVGQLAGGVAHDFNNLLCAITGCAEFLVAQLKDAPQPRADAEEILKTAGRAAALTRPLLAFSRRQTLSPAVVDLNETAAATSKLLRRLIGENIELATSLGGCLGRVKIDPGQMEQAIINLAVNARDAMPKGGKLTISTANFAPSEGFLKEHPDLQPGPHVVLAVSDTGSGIAADILPRIFEPFFTTKEKGKGTGLGLSMVYGFVKQSGGEILVTSAPGAGTRFEICLPQILEPAPLEAERPAAARARGCETILLVEDDDTVRRLTARGLREAGYVVLEAESGEQALRLAQEAGRRIHLLLSDVVMPGMSGAELARRMAGVVQGLRVLYVSGHAQDALGSQGVLAAGIQLLLKPFTQEVLAARVRAVLDSD
jgi:PAS domain S-box-containing protein